MSEQDKSLYENSEYPSRRKAPGSEGKKPGTPGKKSGKGKTALKVIGTLLLIGLCTGALMCAFLAVYIKTVIVPYADLSLDDFPIGENSVMYYLDRETGEYEELVTVLSTTSSIWVDLEDMPKNLINAAVAIEDRRFWEHPGIDWRRTGRAVLDMFAGNSISGGSTITQQLIKNLTDYNETTVKRKIIEMVRALRFTQMHSKEETIEYYLNIIPLGAGCEGVGAASYEYFGKPVSELTLAECASLISITNNPSKYSPYSEAQYETEETGEVWNAQQWNKWRQETVLDNMLKYEMISQEEYDEAVAQELVFQRSENESANSTVYTWYEETVLADVRKDMKEQFNWSDEHISQVLARGGLRIYTCVQPEVQEIAEQVYSDRNNLNYTSKNGNPMQSCITVIDNETGDIAAIVGQFDKKEQNLLKNFANDSKRQPGSSIKPLTVYSPAFEMGLITPITVIDDYPYDMLDDRPWPTNSGKYNYRGMTNVRYGLVHSLNTLAVKVLADYVTVNKSFDFVQDRYGLDLVEALESGDQVFSDKAVAPLSMGGLTEGVSTRDMAQAFATFPNNGLYSEARTYTKVTALVDGEEVLVLDNPVERKPVIKETTAYYVNNVLTDVLIDGYAHGHGVDHMHSAGKTGTTNSNYDLWFVGYTPYYTAAVWTGYDKENESIRYYGSPAVKLWEKVMDKIHVGLPDKPFPNPGGLVTVNYCLDSGLLATEYCKMDPRGSRVDSDKIFKGDVPNGRYCPYHTADSVVKVCLDCPILDADGKETGMYHIAGPYCPEDRVQEMCLPDFERPQIGNAVAKDNIYRKSVVEGYGPCTVHTTPGLPDLLPDLPDLLPDLFPDHNEDGENNGGEGQEGEKPDNKPDTKPDTKPDNKPEEKPEEGEQD